MIKNLIYKPKKGLIGKVYFAFMKFVVKSEYIDVFVCSADTHCDYCAEIFQEPRERFVFLPFGVNDFTKLVNRTNPPENNYILALGRSNRDWDFLIDSFRGTKYKLKIICDELQRADLPENIDLYTNVWQEQTYQFIYNCKIMVIPILDGKIDAGETVLLQTMSFSKPIIITEPSCLADDYVTDGETGLVVPKQRDALLNAINRLEEDEQLYRRIAENSRKLYEEKHSLFRYGTYVGQTLLDRGCIE